VETSGRQVTGLTLTRVLDAEGVRKKDLLVIRVSLFCYLKIAIMIMMAHLFLWSRPFHLSG
jgi:hypothetical protein